MPYNWWAFGTPFTGSGEWNNLPLWIATLPCLKITDIFFNRNVGWLAKYPYAGVIVYSLICIFLYSLVGYGIGRFVQAYIPLAQNKKDNT